MDIVLPRHKHSVSISLLIALIIHGAFILLLIFVHIEHKKTGRLVTIEEVEFMEEKEFNLLKLAAPKIKILPPPPKPAEPETPITKEEPTKPQEPLLKDKAEPIVKKRELPLFKPTIEMKEDKVLDIAKLPKEQLRVKELTSEEILIDKSQPILKASELTPLINLDEVGETRVSQKVLDIVKQIEESKTKRDLVKDFSSNEKLIEKQISDLERKLSKSHGQPVVMLTDKTFDRVKIVDLPETEKEKRKTQQKALWLAEAPTLEEKKESRTSARFKKMDFGTTEVEKKQEVKMKLEEAPKEVKEKKTSSSQIDMLSKLKIMQKKESDSILDTTRIEKKKPVEITGPLKDRKVERSYIPPYPEWARSKGIEANVCLFFVVSPQGEVKKDSIRIEITSGYKELDNLVIEALKLWKFAPLLEKENQIEQWGFITFRFRLE